MSEGISMGVASGSLSSSLEMQKAGAQLIEKTLNKMHETAGTPMNPRVDSNFDFQTSVLGAAYTGKGGGVNKLV